MNRYYNFTIRYSLIFLNWYVGEVSTAVIVANIPHCWPLFRLIFKCNEFNDPRRVGDTTAISTEPSFIKRATRRTAESFGLGTAITSFTQSVGGVNGDRSNGLWATSDDLEMANVAEAPGQKPKISASAEHGRRSEASEASRESKGIVKKVEVSQSSSTLGAQPGPSRSNVD